MSQPLVLYSQLSSGNSTPSLTFANNSITVTPTMYLKVCFAAPPTSGLAAGTFTQDLGYRGLVTSPGNSLIQYNNHTLTATVTGSCSFQTVPGDINMNYTSFTTSDVGVSTNAGLTCSSGLSWNAEVTPTSGSLRGILYSLTLSDGVNPTQSGTGNGTVQTLSINAKALRLQAGTVAPCAPCSNTHTLTITY